MTRIVAFIMHIGRKNSFNPNQIVRMSFVPLIDVFLKNFKESKFMRFLNYFQEMTVMLWIMDSPVWGNGASFQFNLKKGR